MGTSWPGLAGLVWNGHVRVDPQCFGPTAVDELYRDASLADDRLGR